MIKRTIYITTPSRISLKNAQLVCTNKDDETDVKTAPIEDIGCLIVENQRASLTLPVLNALADNNTSVVICNQRTMPNAILVSLDANTTQSEIIRAQQEASAPLKKVLWKQLVTAKIKNQSMLLSKLGKDGARLKPLYCNVKSGDSDNREGAAARLYWPMLFGEDFFRDRNGDGPNILLNYGYSILRAATVRALMGSGLSPAFGLFHHNRYNAMPLADDVMEPYRPFVDEIVYLSYANGDSSLTTEIKTRLAGILTKDTIFGDCMRPLEIGLSTTTSSLAKCVLGLSKSLTLPQLE